MTSCEPSTAAFRSVVGWILETISSACLVEGALGDELREALPDHGHSPVEELLLDVEERDVVTCDLRADLGDAVSHEACAEDGHLPNL